MTRLLILVFVVLCTSCVKTKDTDEPKTSDLVGHYSRQVSFSSVICDAWFSLESDAGNTPVALETDAFMTCNGQLMTRSVNLYTTAITHTPALEVSISLIRRIDGSTLTDTQIVY